MPVKKNNGLTSSPLTKLPHDELHEAILYVQDILGRCLCPFFLLDETAEQMRIEMPTLSLSEINVGVKKSEWTAEAQSTFYSLVPGAEGMKTITTFTYNNVPVNIWIIQNHYTFFDHPDTKWYYTSEFKIPNPFDLYWKSRFIIK